ncbi:MAG: hypothetical protein U9Q06_04495 [Nanoarchaeota archaeon]|nr:hypothetical protein [Nanoarchaeota archaeon]
MKTEEMEKKMNGVRKRIEDGRISRLISYDELTVRTPSKERMMGRLEAYLQTGAVIDPEDLMRTIQEYGFSPEEYQHLIPLAQTGVIEGLVQEPDNMQHYGERIGCFSSLANKFFNGGQNA